MNLQALEVFCEVVRRQSFSRGAATYGISQSAASQLVAHLEEELGFRLIDRKQRPLVPTRAGGTYFEGLRPLLQRHRRLLDEVRREHESLVDTVRVASIYSAGLHTLNRYIQGFMAHYPGATVRLEYFHPSKVVSAVLNDEVDVGVVSYAQGNRQLKVIDWVEEEMVVVCAPDHRVAREISIQLRELANENFVAFDRDLQIRREIDRAMKQCQVSVKVVSEFDNIETIKQALDISQAVTILPSPSIEREVAREHLVGVPIEGVNLRRPLGIVYRRDKKLSSTGEQFIRSLVEGRQSSTDLQNPRPTALRPEGNAPAATTAASDNREEARRSRPRAPSDRPA